MLTIGQSDKKSYPPRPPRIKKLSAHDRIVAELDRLWRDDDGDAPEWADGWFPRSDGKHYEPSAGQRAFHESNARFKILFGGRGAGKSTAGAQEALRRIRRGFSGAVINPDFENFKYSTWPEFRQWIPWDQVVDSDRRMGAETWEPRTNFVIHFKNGARVYCKGLRDPDAARGPNLNWLWYDEAARDKTGLSWQLAIGGVRVGENPTAWATTTPRGGSHWTARQFIKQDIPETTREIMERLGVDRPMFSYHTATIHDNAANLDPMFYASMLTQYAGVFAKQELDGAIIDTVRGLVYSGFGVDNISTDAEFDPARGAVEIAYDDGFSTSPRVFLFLQVADDGTVCVFDEMYHFQHDAAECVAESRDLLVDHYSRAIGNGKIGYNDVVEFGDGENKQSARVRFEIAVGDPSAVQLKNAFRRADIVARAPRERSVIEGIKLVTRMIRGADGSIGLLIHPRCKQFIREMGQDFKWPDRGSEAEDWQWNESTKPIKKDDHGPDAIRYWSTLRLRRAA